MGWGVLLWSMDDPALPSGTVLRVRVRSNIEQAWITLVPAEDGSKEILAMVPLPHLEFFRTRGGAEKFAASFAEYAVTYAETLQDGLPIREKPANNARRSYRLKEGEIIKILEKAEGVEAISTSGAPLEGNWFKVLTQSGSTGYCFSYRLRMFEHETGPLGNEPVQANTGGDRDLELILSRLWYPESYGTMINQNHIDLDALAKNYSFNSGITNGKARIHLERGDTEFPYRKISKTGDRTWIFEGTSLTVTLRSESVLEVRWEDAGAAQSETFVTLPASVESIVNQEKERRQNKFQALYNRGPSFVSVNYGRLSLSSSGEFNWGDINALPGEMLSGPVLGSGSVDLDYYLSGEMAERYTGALALRLNSVSGSRSSLIFVYNMDNQGLRMEYIPSAYVSNRTVSRRAPDPFVIYFSAEN
ncbi:hypothetical protein AGMMS50230_16030 [Spirochaetia bacterium]|nr:hypothetical protein AGMMS50230_16030 [Spirochaetia bacterium]